MLQRRHQNSGRAAKARMVVGHDKFVRGFKCLCEGKLDPCDGKIVAAHVDYAGGKGIGLKVHSEFMVSMCWHHHSEQHRLGWHTFEARYGVDALTTAREIARQSPPIIRAAIAAGHDVGEAAE